MKRNSRDELPSGRVPHTVPYRAAYHNYACAPHPANLVGWATQRGPRPRLVATSHRLASCVIVSGFRAALDLDTYPLRNLIRPRCAERAKTFFPLPQIGLGTRLGKPVLIMHIGFFACFHAISLERSSFSKIATLLFLPL